MKAHTLLLIPVLPVMAFIAVVPLAAGQVAATDSAQSVTVDNNGLSPGRIIDSLAPPRLLLANRYLPETAAEAQHYWASEKLDGVRAYWDGQRLVTRSGLLIKAPGWFTESFPAQPLDGELWIGRGQFDLVSGIVRRQIPEDSAWRQVRYKVFDLPADPRRFEARMRSLDEVVATTGLTWLQAVAQIRMQSEGGLQGFLDAIVTIGGEGLMLRRAGSYYRPGRSDDLLKVTPLQDDEAIVIAHLPGQGKFDGMLGSLRVRHADGREFKLGSGFTNAQRNNPPPVGSRVTFQYSGLTRTGLPRFARFYRQRDDF